MRRRQNDGSPDRRATGTWGLLVLNAVLLGLLAAVTFAPDADAQSRGRGDYTMVAGGVNGSLGSAVYIVDVVNQDLIAVTYDPSTRRLEGLGYRNLAADALEWLRGRSRAP